MACSPEETCGGWGLRRKPVWLLLQARNGSVPKFPRDAHGHSPVYGVAFSPDGTRLAAGCRDNTVRLIDVASHQEVAELHGHTQDVHAVAWSPDGTRLGSGDSTLRVWDRLSNRERAARERALLAKLQAVPPSPSLSSTGARSFRNRVEVPGRLKSLPALAPRAAPGKGQSRETLFRPLWVSLGAKVSRHTVLPVTISPA